MKIDAYHKKETLHGHPKGTAHLVLPPCKLTNDILSVRGKVHLEGLSL
jgi:hypothetical protein